MQYGQREQTLNLNAAQLYNQRLLQHMYGNQLTLFHAGYNAGYNQIDGNIRVNQMITGYKNQIQQQAGIVDSQGQMIANLRAQTGQQARSREAILDQSKRLTQAYVNLHAKYDQSKLDFDIQQRNFYKQLEQQNDINVQQKEEAYAQFNNDLANQRRMYQASINDFQQYHDMVQSENNQQLESLKAESYDWQSQARRAREKYQGLESDLQSQVRYNEQLEQQLASQRLEAVNMQGTVDNALWEKEHYARERRNLNADYQRVTQNQIDQVNGYKSSMEGFRDERDEMKNKLFDIKQQNKEYTNQIAQLNDQIAQQVVDNYDRDAKNIKTVGNIHVMASVQERIRHVHGQRNGFKSRIENLKAVGKKNEQLFQAAIREYQLLGERIGTDGQPNTEDNQRIAELKLQNALLVDKAARYNAEAQRLRREAVKPVVERIDFSNQVDVAGEIANVNRQAGVELGIQAVAVDVDQGLFQQQLAGQLANVNQIGVVNRAADFIVRPDQRYNQEEWLALTKAQQQLVHIAQEERLQAQAKGKRVTQQGGDPAVDKQQKDRAYSKKFFKQKNYYSHQYLRKPKHGDYGYIDYGYSKPRLMK